MDPDDLSRRIHELEAELEDLKRARQPDSNPSLVLDVQGVILEIRGSWFGEPLPDCVGSPLASLFEEPEARDLQDAIAARLCGISELCLRDRDGRWIVPQPQPQPPPAPGGGAPREQEVWRIVLCDVSRHEILSRAWARQREARALLELAGCLAGELIDPMSIVQGRLELMLELGITDLQVAERHLGVALEHAWRVNTALRNLRMVGRAPTIQLEEVSLAEITDEALELLGPWRSRVVVELQPPELTVGGDVPRIARILTSLLRLSLEGAGRSSVVLSARRHQDEILIGIGPLGRPRGAPDPCRAGLAFERSLLERLGGRLAAWSRGVDTHFELSLCRPAILRRRPRIVDHTLLLVGSSPFRDTVRLTLDKDGFRFLESDDGAAARAVTQQQPRGAIGAVITELVLPSGLSGFALAESLQGEEDPLRVLVVGIGDGAGWIASLGPGVVPIGWPPRRAALLEALGRRVRRT